MHRPLASARLEVDGRLSAKEIHKGSSTSGLNFQPSKQAASRALTTRSTNVEHANNDYGSDGLGQALVTKMSSTAARRWQQRSQSIGHEYECNGDTMMAGTAITTSPNDHCKASMTNFAPK